MKKPQKNYFSSREAADLLGVAVSTIQLWTNSGLLRAWTTGGGHRRIARESVNELLVQQQAVMCDQKVKSQKLTVLIVEDNIQQLRLYKKQFSIWEISAHITTANDGYEGLIRVGQILPDIIITDLRMPNIDGFQMINAIKKLPALKHCLIIVATGLTADEIEMQGGLPADVHLLIKPIPPERLEMLIRQKLAATAALRV